MTERPNICRILSLDGGGAKGFYTLGILREIEAMLPRPLHETFDLIFGTSTGSIIAAFLSLGYSVDDIHARYCEHVPRIMQAGCRTAKSRALKAVANQVFEEKGFEAVLTGLGIVSTKWQLETPMIFKSRNTQAHGRSATFVPGFGCRIADAVEASCAAYPFFNRKIVTTSAGDEVELFDGGYCANNPTLYAIADATSSLGYFPEDCRVLSLGCGQYPEPKRGYFNRSTRKIPPAKLLYKTLEVNTKSMEELRNLLFKHVKIVRISDTFNKPEFATDMFETDLRKLNLLCQQGAMSFASREADVFRLLMTEEN